MVHIHDHEKAAISVKALHVHNTRIVDALLDFRPHIGMVLDVLLDKYGVGPKVEHQTVSFHSTLCVAWM